MDERNRDERNQAKSRKVLGFCILAIVFIYFLIANGRANTDLVFNDVDNTLTLSYSQKDAELDPVVIKIDEIVSMEIREDVDYGTLVSGAENNTAWFGTWKNEEFGEYGLCISPNIKNCCVVECTDGYVVFNMESKDTTASLMDAIQDIIDGE